MTAIEIVEYKELEAGDHVELDVGDNRKVFVTTTAETTSVVLADETQKKQASIMLKNGSGHFESVSRGLGSGCGHTRHTGRPRHPRVSCSVS